MGSFRLIYMRAFHTAFLLFAVCSLVVIGAASASRQYRASFRCRISLTFGQEVALRDSCGVQKCFACRHQARLSQTRPQMVPMPPLLPVPAPHTALACTPTKTLIIRSLVRMLERACSLLTHRHATAIPLYQCCVTCRFSYQENGGNQRRVRGAL